MAEPEEPQEGGAPGAGASNPASSLGLGLTGAAQGRGLSATELIALVLSVLWLGGCTLFFLFFGTSSGGDPLRVVIVVLAVFMPVAMIWVAAAASRSARIMREESQRLHVAIEALRRAYLQQQQSGALGRHAADVERKLDALAQAQRKTESAIATFSSRRAPGSLPPAPRVVNPPQPAPEEAQPALALGTPAEAIAAPLSTADFIRALNFPENADDKEGFRALRLALQDHQVSGLIRAAQDVLTLLSQEGIYMDDLRPDMPRPEIWRRFAAGERGRAVAGLGGVRDRSSLALSAGRMRSDPVFRDAVHHFLRKFDRVITEFAESASDQDLAELAETRTARAFMLLGRVTGTFD